MVSPKGKESKTTFERLNYNGKSSTVLAKPLTGRMHQIRVHLQWLGHPIVNDSFYNTKAWGPCVGKGGEYGKSLEELIKAVELEHQKVNHIVAENGGDSYDPRKDSSVMDKDRIAIKALEHYFTQDGWKEKVEEYSQDKRGLKGKIEEHFEDCFDCLNPTYDPTPSEQMIYLHAVKYTVDEDWKFQTQYPVWAKDTWDED